MDLQLEPQSLAIDNEFVERALGAYTPSPLSLQLEHERCTLRLLTQFVNKCTQPPSSLTTEQCR